MSLIDLIKVEAVIAGREIVLARAGGPTGLVAITIDGSAVRVAEELDLTSDPFAWPVKPDENAWFTAAMILELERSDLTRELSLEDDMQEFADVSAVAELLKRVGGVA